MRRMILVLCLGLFGVACAQEETPATPEAASPEPASPEPASPEPESPAAQEAGVSVDATESDLGTILTDEEGRTLYVFLSDSEGESTCYDDCAQAWPALETEGDPEAGEAADASLLGTTEREDGAVQVTYNEMPLYYYADDAEPGDTNGQGVGDVWYVVSTEGEPVQE